MATCVSFDRRSMSHALPWAASVALALVVFSMESVAPGMCDGAPKQSQLQNLYRWTHATVMSRIRGIPLQQLWF